MTKQERFFYLVWFTLTILGGGYIGWNLRVIYERLASTASWIITCM